MHANLLPLQESFFDFVGCFIFAMHLIVEIHKTFIVDALLGHDEPNLIKAIEPLCNADLGLTYKEPHLKAIS